KGLLSHLNLIHGIDKNFTCLCPVEDCFRKFIKYDTLYRHVRKDHKAILGLLKRATVDERETGPNDANNTEHEDNNNNSTASDDDDDEEEFQEEKESNFHQLLELQTRKLILLLKSHKIPQHIIDCTVSTTSALFDTTVNLCMDIVKKQSLDGQEDTYQAICEESNEIINPFTGLNTKYLQDKFLDEIIHLKPVEMSLGKSFRYKRKRNGEKVLQECDDTFAFISVLDTLAEMLSDDNLAKELLKPVKKKDS
uniref:C2H2-type domain-containing protein n=1 Tax=Clytia hemisphaerica TaxID=252671 RepID=A0A7M5XHF3_9CNID